MYVAHERRIAGVLGQISHFLQNNQFGRGSEFSTLSKLLDPLKEVICHFGKVPVSEHMEASSYLQFGQRGEIVHVVGQGAFRQRASRGSQE